MAGYDQNPQFPGPQSGLPTRVPSIPAVPLAGNNPQAVGGDSIRVAVPLTPVTQVPLAQPQPVQTQATAPALAKRRASVARPVAVQPGSAASASTAAQPIPAPATAGGTSFGMPLIRTDSDEDEEAEVVTDKAIRAAPPWLVSGVVHMIALILMGVLYLANNRENKVQIEAIYAETLGVQLEDDILQDSGQMEMPNVKDAALSVDVIQVADPFAAPPQLDPSLLSADAIKSVSDILAPSIGLALTGREKGAKQALLGAYGGTATTEGAVQLGLEWLVKQQNARSGLWSLQGPYADGGGYENILAATAMALLALQGNGNTHQSGKFARNVEKGADALVKMQDQDGNMFREGGFNHRLYSQAQATIALCELYGMTKDSRYRQPAQKALDYASRIQAPQGGWRYVPKEDTDTSVTGWFVMAMQSGLMAGLTVQSPTLDGVRKYLDSATPDGSFYSYQARGEPTLPMTAEGLLCRQYLGWEHDDPRLRTGVDYLLKNLITYDEQDLYYWYYATQVLHHMGGGDWDKWNKIMRQAVPEHQVKEGRERGSWDPKDDRWGNHGGRLYATCLSCYLLEVYYRHLPIYKHFNLPASLLSPPAEKTD
jgi:hypothetical protein